MPIILDLPLVALVIKLWEILSYSRKQHQLVYMREMAFTGNKFGSGCWTWCRKLMMDRISNRVSMVHPVVPAVMAEE